MSTGDVVVNGRFKLVTKIGHGSFGDIYRGIDLTVAAGKPEAEVAVKLEHSRIAKPQLAHEHEVYRALAGAEGVAKVVWFGNQGDYRVLAMELLGPNLLQLLAFCGNRFSLKTVLMLADQMITRLEMVHEHNLIHRDLKPQNFLMGQHGVQANTVHLIDYGLSLQYRDPTTGNHIPWNKERTMVGTLRYASVNCHTGGEQSRRDDMESLAYLLIFLLHGSLPWMGVKGATPTMKESRILQSKTETPIEEICSPAPPEFAQYLKYCREMAFEARPDYQFLRGLFRSRFQQEGYKLDYLFDWTLIRLVCFSCPILYREKWKGIHGISSPNQQKEHETRLADRAALVCPPRE